MAAVQAYKAEDHSILLPYYKRYLVEPTLRFIPAKVHPNTITHAGHLLNLTAVGILLALRPERGWLLFLSMLLVQGYVWADNVDGAHARRTGQSSAFGEFLDHGLDILNTTYIAIIVAWSLGTTHLWAIAMISLIPAAAAVTCWEQAQTGVYRLGMLNQIESVVVLSFTMLGDTLFGIDLWKRLEWHGVSAFHFFMIWPAATMIFGFGRAMLRVLHARGSVAPIVPFLLLHVLIVLAGAQGWVSTLAGCAFACAVNIWFGVRQLVLRLHGQPPKVEPLLVAAIVAMLAFMASSAAGHSIDARYAVAVPAMICGVTALIALRDTRRGIGVLQEVEGR